jgi:endonuclease-3
MIKEEITKINKLLIKKYGLPIQKNPNPDPVDILIATILSQNTNDRNSYKSFINLKNEFQSWDEVAISDLITIEKPIRSAGFSLPKAKAIKSFLNYLLDTYGKISMDYISTMGDKEALEELMSHKGIGIKTASCVLMFAFHRNICPVDRHIFRVINRVGIIKSTTPDKMSVALNKELPGNSAHPLHANLIRLGREICRQTLPNCSICPIFKHCAYEYKNMSENVEYKESTFLLLDNIE